MLVRSANHFSIPNRRGLDYYPIRNLPELNQILSKLPDNTILDGEIVAFNQNGEIDRLLAQRRCGTKIFSKAQRLAKKIPVYFYAFDILRLRGEDLESKSFVNRKRILASLVEEVNDEHLLYLPYKESGFADLFVAEPEGIVLKRKDVRYLHARVDYWIKVKHTMQKLCNVVGFTTGGTGWRAKYWRSLVLVDDDGKYAGKVGGGFTNEEVERIWQILQKCPQEYAWRIDGKKLDYIRCNSGLKVEITYCDTTPNGIAFQPRKKRVYYPSKPLNVQIQKTL